MNYQADFVEGQVLFTEAKAKSPDLRHLQAAMFLDRLGLWPAKRRCHRWHPCRYLGGSSYPGEMGQEDGLWSLPKQLPQLYCFSITEAVTMEDLQFSPRGKVKEDIDAGRFNLDGEQPIQPDGGLKCFGHPIGASGLRMMYEMYKQLQGKSGERQIKNPKFGLTHNLGGFPSMNVNSIFIVGL